MPEPYHMFSISEGQIAVMEPSGGGVLVSNGVVTHLAGQGETVERYMAECGDERDKKNLKEGRLFQRTIPGLGTHLFTPSDRPVPLDIYIQGLEFQETKRYEEWDKLAESHGLERSDWRWDGPDMLSGLKALKEVMNQAKSGQLSIEELLPPSDKGKPHAR